MLTFRLGGSHVHRPFLRIGPQVDIEKLIYSGSAWVIPILIAITFHEAAHA
jgi:hypothetical protein